MLYLLSVGLLETIVGIKEIIGFIFPIWLKMENKREINLTIIQ